VRWQAEFQEVARSVRPRPEEPVSTPLIWQEVNNRVDPNRFTMRAGDRFGFRAEFLAVACRVDYNWSESHTRSFGSHSPMLAKLNTFDLVGIDGVPVKAEMDVSQGLRKTVLVGIPAKAHVRRRHHSHGVAVPRYFKSLVLCDQDEIPKLADPAAKLQ
jgi:hypothetical protein